MADTPTPTKNTEDALKAAVDDYLSGKIDEGQFRAVLSEWLIERGKLKAGRLVIPTSALHRMTFGYYLSNEVDRDTVVAVERMVSKRSLKEDWLASEPAVEIEPQTPPKIEILKAVDEGFIHQSVVPDYIPITDDGMQAAAVLYLKEEITAHIFMATFEKWAKNKKLIESTFPTDGYYGYNLTQWYIANDITREMLDAGMRARAEIDMAKLRERQMARVQSVVEKATVKDVSEAAKAHEAGHLSDDQFLTVLGKWLAENHHIEPGAKIEPNAELQATMSRLFMSSDEWTIAPLRVVTGMRVKADREKNALPAQDVRKAFIRVGGGRDGFTLSDGWVQLRVARIEADIDNEDASVNEINEVLTRLNEYREADLRRAGLSDEVRGSVIVRLAEMDADERLIDVMAEAQHRVWAHWMQYLFSKCVPQYTDNGQVGVTIPQKLVERWERQILTAYENLTEEERESDRQVVRDHILTSPLLKAALFGPLDTNKE